MELHALFIKDEHKLIPGSHWLSGCIFMYEECMKGLQLCPQQILYYLSLRRCLIWTLMAEGITFLLFYFFSHTYTVVWGRVLFKCCSIVSCLWTQPSIQTTESSKTGSSFSVCLRNSSTERHVPGQHWSQTQLSVSSENKQTHYLLLVWVFF